MKRIQFKKIYLVAIVAFFASCDGYLGGETDIDPNRPKTTSLAALLSSSIESTANNHYLIGYFTAQFSQHVATYAVDGSDAYFETRIPTGWTGIYLTALTNLDQLVKQAQEEGSPHYEGIAKILQAINLGLATDCWGNVPFSAAFKGAEDLTPSYDSQDQIYATINTLLTDAIALLGQPVQPFKPVPGTDDLIYLGGTTGYAAWIRTAYALKARYALHYTKLNPSQASDNALEAVSRAISDNAQDFQLVYNGTNRNPWYNNVSATISTGNLTVAPSRTLISIMNGAQYPGVNDPRLPIMFTSTTTPPTPPAFNGITNGAGVIGAVSTLGVSTFYTRDVAPLPMVTFAEMKFIEAEAHFLARGGTTTSVGTISAEAYAAYRAGITAHMQKLGVTAPNIANYLANANAVAPNAAALTLELIMKEKFIAMFLNPENWTDVRRYDYSNAIYRGMQLPVRINPAMGGQFIRRVLYPLDEVNRNGAEVAPNVKQMQERMWWN
jgi:Starch-binding associating with outer membrane